jgi:ABC-type glycerol-3-phosphate transport system substrate-binding protein
MFTAEGDVMFDNDAAVEVVCWYVQQIQGKDRISFAAGWGQNLAKSMLDGLCLFYIAPDWRTMQFQADVPKLSGTVAIMPMPAWKPGGIRTSTWGATGLAITRQSKNFDLAWKLAMHLYYVPEELGPRFAKTNILPPYIPAWSQPEFDEPREFYSGMKLGREYANLAPDVPDEKANAYMQQAEGKLTEAFEAVRLYHAKNGNDGLREYAAAELKKRADDIRRIAARNVFLNPPAGGGK